MFRYIIYVDKKERLLRNELKFSLKKNNLETILLIHIYFVI